MIAKYDKPPYQPKWILQLQVFLLRHLKSSFSKQTMIITTTGRKTGHQHSVPIGCIRDGDTLSPSGLNTECWDGYPTGCACNI